MKYLISGVLCMMLLSSCAFNGRFHRPISIPYDIEILSEYNYGNGVKYFEYDQKSSLVSLSNSNKEIINTNYNIESMFFMSSSKNLLNGWMITPKETTPIATILHFHGSGTNLLNQYQTITPLVERGFQVFTFDYSGYGFSEGKPTRKNAFNDAVSALDFVSNMETNKNTQLIIYGQSYGGYLAAVVGSNADVNNIKGLVIEGAFSSHKQEAVYTTPFWGKLVKNELVADIEIQKFKMPTLVIHSNEDTDVPIRFGEKIFDNANNPKEFYEIDHSHILGLQFYADEIKSKIEKLMLD